MRVTEESETRVELQLNCMNSHFRLKLLKHASKSAETFALSFLLSPFSPLLTNLTQMEPEEAAVTAVSAYDGSGDEGMLVLDGGDVGGGKDRVKGPWSPEEDAILSRLVSKFGARNWSLIARGISGRSGKSCRLRWCNQLDPSVKRKPFTGT